MQTTDRPMACMLPADQLQQRLKWIQAVTADHLMAHRFDGRTLHLTYRSEAKRDLEWIVVEERRCCAFLRFSLHEVSERIELEIEALETAGPDAHEHFAYFLPMAPRAPAPKACGCAPGRCG